MQTLSRLRCPKRRATATFWCLPDLRSDRRVPDHHLDHRRNLDPRRAKHLGGRSPNLDRDQPKFVYHHHHRHELLRDLPARLRHPRRLQRNQRDSGRLRNHDRRRPLAGDYGRPTTTNAADLRADGGSLLQRRGHRSRSKQRMDSARRSHREPIRWPLPINSSTQQVRTQPPGAATAPRKLPRSSSR